ncbi:uncharacterized protein LOC104891467 [Beta vulgaris subsp. vulgaris]|uniref:uncharacterized protein LOC104891467 n=1 Tax=Beta vulgaris subsp. vulgaris TaxID=3555 RepID=UPI002036CE3D|nr:uncharacterized protein LOC104891467 [Beta vulgaris subsp. vulgaris]
MRKSQSASISPNNGGNGIRLGVRTRKKHKKLDAICEDEYTRNRRVSNQGTSGGGHLGGDSEVRRSSRARRVPVILDSSPPPPRKRRKVGKLGEKVGGVLVKKSRGKGKVKDETPSSSADSEEELGAWRSRLRLRGKNVSPNQPRGKRKLVWDDDEEISSVKGDPKEEMPCLNSNSLRVTKSTEPDSARGLVDGEDELHEDHSVDDSLENGVDASEKDSDGDCVPSTSGRIVGNEEIVDDSPVHLLVKESPEEKLNRIANVEDHEQNHEPLDPLILVEDAENKRQVTEATAVPSDLAEDVECDVIHEEVVAEAKESRAAVENGANLGKCNVTAGGIPRSRVEKGRRCGLCGGGTDGKPPKVMANDSAGSDQEAYSGSSASEDCNYDPWDGFGDEPGWLGRLLGPINDRYGIAGIWVHQHCAVWSPEVYFAGLGCLRNIKAALCRGRTLKCTRCGRPGATLGCRVDRCPRTYHLPCARASGCIFDHRKFLIACADHRYLFQPQGHQYAQHIKKLKAKKMKLEVRKLSNDASRKDLEAEEKWLEKCGEDEEFLRRETKRLQRDLLRIAPVYIGGPHSGADDPFEGWDSVAGLQNVIQCMKEVVILPLLYPEFFENMGITPPRGVLLHGYPGTGKTLVVRALIGSCARGDKRIAFFARKGADCLGKYVGDAERQLRLLFQVAEKSQPSIIFFDEIDGLAPVRTRQQDQTHSSVVSTLLALMDGLKSRGSVIVIGATNRPDAVDPALRRPGRFDREVYFPLPSMKDRASILALHTRKWPKPVSGTLLEWVSARTVGFAGADLQALCAQAAVIALKRNCSWHQILSFAGDTPEQGRRPQLPSFVVEERDWLEALSLAPPPCSLREAGMAANEVVGFPLHIHLIPFLLQPLLSLMISLYLDDRLWLPHCLINAGAAIKRIVVSLMEKKGLWADKWWCHAQDLVQDPDTRKEIVRSLRIAGIVDGDASSAGCDLLKDAPIDNGGCHPCDLDFNPSGSVRNLCYAPLKKTGYRILISGDPKSGQKHIVSCLLHCFVGSIEMQKIDLATISQEGHGDLEQGISHILMKCASVKLCTLFMPRIDLWAIRSCPSAQEDVEKSSPMSSRSESMQETDYQDEICSASHIWRSFMEQVECIRVSSSLIILATSELPISALPQELRHFFGSELSTPEGSILSEYGTPRFVVEVEEEIDQDKLIHLSASDLTRDLIQQFVQLVHIENHRFPEPKITCKAHHEDKSHRSDLKSVEEPREKQEPVGSSVAKLPVPPCPRNVKGKSSLISAITAFGYQILKYPHFAELCWITSKLSEGPNSDIRGTWKGWPFNSCIVRPCKSMSRDTVACNTNNSKGKDQFTLVRGLVAVGLSAYRGIYTSPMEVALEVRKVLELLIGQIAARIQAGKDRYQYIHILSQIAYLEDMVNNWSYSLRSLEPDAKHMQGGEEPTFEPGLAKDGLKGSSAGRPANLNTPGANTLEVEKQPIIQGSGFEQPELEEVLQETFAESSQPAVLNMKTIDIGVNNLMEAVNFDEESAQKAVATNEVASSICSAGEVGNQEKESPNEMLLRSNPVSLVDPVIDQSCSKISCASELKHLKDITVTVGHMQSTEASRQLACTAYLGDQTAGSCNSGELGNTQSHVSSELCNQTIPESLDENEISAEAGKCTSDLHRQDSRTSVSIDLSSESKVICCYSCCMGCIYSLHQLVKKLVAREQKLSSSCCTVEDVHDLVSTLSSSLCSRIRNLYVTEGCSSYENGGLRSRKLESQEIRNTPNEPAKLMECVCHSGKDFSKEVDLSSYHQTESDLKYIFRDGVLVSAVPDKESPFHCKYGTLCLSSLIELVIGIK